MWNPWDEVNYKTIFILSISWGKNFANRSFSNILQKKLSWEGAKNAKPSSRKVSDFYSINHKKKKKRKEKKEIQNTKLSKRCIE